MNEEKTFPKVKVGCLVKILPEFYKPTDIFKNYPYSLAHLEADGKTTHNTYRNTDSLFLVISIEKEKSVLAPYGWGTLTDQIDLPTKGLEVVRS